MRSQTKLICIGAILMVLLSGIIVLAVFDDVEGPLIYQVDILPVTPAPGDSISVIIYALDTSGVSGAQISWSINGEEWQEKEMSFFACLCISGGRWVTSFGPVQDGDALEFYATAYDDSPYANPSDTPTFSFQISS
ncbi:MAG: hypothetical protein ACXAAR_00905 [Candidatus Thorarchaeota archaeon]|jgi:hypothetical protein